MKITPLAVLIQQGAILMLFCIRQLSSPFCRDSIVNCTMSHFISRNTRCPVKTSLRGPQFIALCSQRVSLQHGHVVLWTANDATATQVYPTNSPSSLRIFPFTTSDVLSATQPTVSKHWRKLRATGTHTTEIKLKRNTKTNSYDKTALFQLSHNTWNKTPKRFGSRLSPFACFKTAKMFHTCFSVFVSVFISTVPAS